ncbi:hypothetical protein HEK616_09210 [Streptomyces nigrescens]|uniref:Uncharacterized protein n=1 Tax=Streptomyces nigrescens TaxID=1920 RepID=A0ABN6QMJ2_STRNI|nr:hypothetical protein HEK616_09210 [Streptomyces nigrescens]
MATLGHGRGGSGGGPGAGGGSGPAGGRQDLARDLRDGSVVGGDPDGVGVGSLVEQAGLAGAAAAFVVLREGWQGVAGVGERFRAGRWRAEAIAWRSGP